MRRLLYPSPSQGSDGSRVGAEYTWAARNTAALLTQPRRACLPQRRSRQPFFATASSEASPITPVTRGPAEWPYLPGPAQPMPRFFSVVSVGQTRDLYGVHGTGDPYSGQPSGCARPNFVVHLLATLLPDKRRVVYRLVRGGVKTIAPGYNQPIRSARRAASTRLRAPSFLIAVER